MRAVVSGRSWQRRGRTKWLIFPLLAVSLTGCFQSANDTVSPTRTNLTGIAPVDGSNGVADTPAPFITPISTGGFITPTDDPILLTLSAQPPVITSIPTDASSGVFAPTQPGAANPANPGEPTAALGAGAPPTATAASVLLPTPTALPTEGPCIHTVQPGEWMYSIARKFNINPADLIAANPKYASNPDSLQPGDVLKMPNCTAQPTAPPTPTPPSLLPLPTSGAPASGGIQPSPIPLSGREYTVVQGDTLGSIARKFNTTVQALKDANGIGTSDYLRIGQVLQIPASQ